MKIVIIYDSLYGNTEKIVMAIKDGFGNEHEVHTVKAYDLNTVDLEKTELLLVGSPTHAGRYTEAVKTALEQLSDKSIASVKAIAFDTCMALDGKGALLNRVIKLFGSASDRIADELKKSGAEVVEVKSFTVLGKQGPLKNFEIQRARDWSKGLIK